MDSSSDHDLETCTVQDLDGYRGALGGLTRRQFLKYCTGVAATLGLSSLMGIRIAEAATAATRPPVIWLSAQNAPVAPSHCCAPIIRRSKP